MQQILRLLEDIAKYAKMKKYFVSCEVYQFEYNYFVCLTVYQ